MADGPQLDEAQRQKVADLVYTFRKNGMLDEAPARTILNTSDLRGTVQRLRRNGQLFDSVANTLLQHVLTETPGSSVAPTYDDVIDSFVGRIPVREDTHVRPY